MKQGLQPDIRPEHAKQLLELRAGFKAGSPFEHVLRDYWSKTYQQLLVAPDDQLAGFRGMLLCINNLSNALTPEELQATIEKAERRNNA